MHAKQDSIAIAERRSSPNHAPSTMSSGTPDIAELASAPFDQENWDRWQARGRAEDAAIARRLRTTALCAAAIGILGALIWIVA